MLHLVSEQWFSNDFWALGSELVVFWLRNLVGMGLQFISHTIDCELRRVVKLDALRTEKNLGKVMRVHTHDYIRDSFLLNSKGFGEKEGSYW